MIFHKKIIARIEDIHTMNYIHCDLKPQNMLMGLGDSADIVRIIDFGLAMQYRDPVTQEHKPVLKNPGHIFLLILNVDINFRNFL